MTKAKDLNLHNQFSFPSLESKSLTDVNPMLSGNDVMISSKMAREKTKENLTKLSQLTGKPFKI
jgi:hypothetical protein